MQDTRYECKQGVHMRGGNMRCGNDTLSCGFASCDVAVYISIRPRSKVTESTAQIHNCETARDMRETAVSRWGVSRETARDSARQRETARDSARQPRDSRESYVKPRNEPVALRSYRFVCVFTKIHVLPRGTKRTQ